MRGRLWSLVGAAIGAAILAILFAFGIEYGTWVDEAGQLEVPPPAFVFPFVIGCLAIVLLVGGSWHRRAVRERARIQAAERRAERTRCLDTGALEAGLVSSQHVIGA
jgi:hypothetical protein